jgi:3,4-dihydroxy-2-butanone 4-phosphate synthase
MVRAAAVLRVILCAWVLGTALPAAAQVTASFTPDRAAYERLGNSKESRTSLPAAYATKSSGTKSVRPTKRQVMDAIWNASQQTGVEYSYLLAQAHLESGLNPAAKARTSSAAGLFQFIEGTWLRSLDRYSGQLGSYSYGNELEAGNTAWTSRTMGSVQASRQEKLSWRHDPRLASLVAAAYAMENGKRLERVLGRSATGTELYMAHFLGTGGASRFMVAWKRNPDRIAAHLFPKAARANRSVFYARSGRARSLEGVLRHFDKKIDSALALFDMPMTEKGAVRETADLLSFADIAPDQGSSQSHPGIDKTLAKAEGQFKQDNTTKFDIPYVLQGIGIAFEERLSRLIGLNAEDLTPNHTARSQTQICNHIEMCYSKGMSTSTITQVRSLIDMGAYTKAGIARAAGLHANTLRDASEEDWNPTAETLAKLQKFLDANDDTPVLVSAEEIIDEARNGRMYILVDDEDRENEGDLIIPAQMATPSAVNFMATHGRGLICLALDKARVDQLGLDPMSRNNKESMQTAFTVSIEAKEGVTTGISAADRARTISVAIDASKGADDIVTPGHVFPLMARDGGTLVRAGHTEAAVDISRLAGLNPSGVICEIMNEDGTMARLDDLIEFARKHDLKIGTIRDLIAYRMRNDHLVERVDERSFESDYGGQWRMITYRNTVSDSEAYVLQKGHITPDEPTLTRVHPISVFDDVLGAPGPRKRTLQRAMGAIGDKGAGVIVILTQRVGRGAKWTPDEEHRNIGIGSQILADLGVQEMILLSNSRPDLVALEGYGISVAGHQPIPE